MVMSAKPENPMRSVNDAAERVFLSDMDLKARSMAGMGRRWSEVIGRVQLMSVVSELLWDCAILSPSLLSWQISPIDFLHLPGNLKNFSSD